MREDMFSHFGRTQDCDVQTDRRTSERMQGNCIYHASLESHGIEKNARHF